MNWKPVATPSKEEIAEFLKDRKKSARFLVDESAGTELASQMKEIGLNVKYVDDVGLRGRSDEEVFAYARKQNRVILTHDEDFMNNRQIPIYLSPGIVKIPGASGDEDALVQAVSQVVSMFGNLGQFFEKTKISITSEGIWTINKFNQDTGIITKSIYKFPRNGDAMEWLTTNA